MKDLLNTLPDELYIKIYKKTLNLDEELNKHLWDKKNHKWRSHAHCFKCLKYDVALLPINNLESKLVIIPECIGSDHFTKDTKLICWECAH